MSSSHLDPLIQQSWTQHGRIPDQSGTNQALLQRVCSDSKISRLDLAYIVWAFY